VIETSLNVFNTSAYHPWVHPVGTLMSWMRGVVANRLAFDGESWIDLMTKFESGTYPNQWMILNAEKFDAAAVEQASRDLREDSCNGCSSLRELNGLFMVLEESPGLVHSEDMTETLLRDGYWGSYNVARFLDIRQRLNDTEPYFDCPRAKLFASLQDSVVDLHSMEKVMGWNNFEAEPLITHGDPGNAIMARDDLRPMDSPFRKLHGGVDAKCSSLLLSRNPSNLGINGHRADDDDDDAEWAADTDDEGIVRHHKPRDALVSRVRAGMAHNPLSPFCWDIGSKDDVDNPRKGHPECFDFDWGDVSPSNFL
jgi:hypothetical protein